MTTILVVDDSAVDRKLASRILEKSDLYVVEELADGAEALARLKRGPPPELVLSDLQMPNVDGLELVLTIRRKHPFVPVIIMTAFGSETNAVLALEAGAASYVPKSKLAIDLLPTVESVLAVTRADRTNDRLLASLASSTWSFSLENDPQLLPPLIDHLQQIVSALQLTDETGRIRLGIALEEALQLAQARTSAAGSTGRIQIDARLNPQQATFVIRQSGTPFVRGSQSNQSTPELLEGPENRGLVLMRTFMDSVEFSADGSQVTLLKRREG